MISVFFWGGPPRPPQETPIRASETIADIVTDEILDAAYTWLCKRRKDWSASADVWRFRHNWSQEKERLREELLTVTHGWLALVALREQVWNRLLRAR